MAIYGYKAVAIIIAVGLIGQSCAQKEKSAKVSNQSTSVEERLTAAEKSIYFETDDLYSDEMVSVIDDTILPLPEIGFCSPFDGVEIAKGAEGYYEEFKEFNIPMAMTSRVSAYINYFTVRVPKTTQAWLDRSNKYMYLVQDIFIKEGLPSDLVVLAFTESGYNTHAVSHAGAAGMWQFIPSTGKIYGMENNFWVDERRDFEKATHAAAKYLKHLYAQFGDWYLALAAYNAGPGRIARAAKKHDTKDFFTISRNRYTLKLETRDYVPKFLAQLIIYKNYLKYDFTPPSDMPLLFADVELPSQTNIYWLANKLGISSDTLRELNPALKLPMTPPSAGYILRVPYGMGEEAERIIASATAEELAMYKIYNAKQGEKISLIAKKYGTKSDDIKSLNGLKYDNVFAARPIFIPVSGMTDPLIDREFASLLAKLAPQYYMVKKGDTFIEIAHRHNMRQADLQKLNPSLRASRIYPGQQLVVSEGVSTVKRAVIQTAKAKKKTTATLTNNKYRVRSGDSLWSIAKKFGTTVDKIIAQNKLSSTGIRPGQSLVVKK